MSSNLFRGRSSGSFPHKNLIDPLTGDPNPVLLSRPWLEQRLKSELIDLVLDLALELKSRSGSTTVTGFDIRELESSLEGKTYIQASAQVDYYQRLPVHSEKTPKEAEATTWRIVLSRVDGQYLPIGVEVYDDIILGRQVEDLNIDLDLTPLGAEELGVSRIHAAIHPQKHALILYDMHSSNGTSCDGQVCSIDHPCRIENDSVIRLGALFVRVRIIDRPPYQSW